jgi:S-DNA-T family DNA segregation ATPase FtsK/SpoIIIE
MLQRRLKLGYARAARIVDEMEEKGIVGPFEGSKPRQMLITKEQWEAMKNGASAPETDPLLADIPVEDLID